MRVTAFYVNEPWFINQATAQLYTSELKWINVYKQLIAQTCNQDVILPLERTIPIKQVAKYNIVFISHI